MDRTENISFSTKVSKERGQKNIRFICGIEKGFPCWFYLELHAQKANKYFKEIEKSAIDIQQFGTVLECGWGEFPPADIVERMYEKYHFRTTETE